MRKVFVITLMLLLLSVSQVSAGDIGVYINDQQKSFTPAPQIIDDKTLVPMRAFFEALGASVFWVEDSRTVLGIKGNTRVVLQIDSKYASVNGVVRTLEVPAQIISDRTFIPLRFVGEALGKDVSWENATRTVRVNDKVVPNSSNNTISTIPNYNINNQPASSPSTVPSTEPKEEPNNAPQGLSEYEAKVVDLVNQERAKANLSPLKANVELSKVARVKSEDMRDSRYFAHNSPTYGTPFQMMQKFGISYRTAGENIAGGQRSPEQVVSSWMNSPGHRANILNSDYTEIGVGFAQGGSYGTYWTQMFIGR